MKKRSVVALGPGAPSLILIFVVLAMSMLGMLALMNGRNDLKLSERSIKVTQAVYELNVRAEESRAEIDDILKRERSLSQDNGQYLSRIERTLPLEYTLEYGDVQEEGPIARISWTETDGMRNLHCALNVFSMDDEIREEWEQHSLISATAEAAQAEEDEGVEFDW